ncbi:MAG: cache domain-containing protein [Proteobacteria bacterium]|nr:cache domain-containing protein [Pseudomonadota bacterium]
MITYAAKKIYNKFKSFEIRYKFIVIFFIIFFMAMLFFSLFIYIFIKNNIEKNIENELNNTTQMILNMVKTSATVSIKNHLRAIAEKNREIIRSLYQLSLEGKMTVAEAKKQSATILLSQTIGISGYVYCLDSAGTVVVHPQSGLINSNVAYYRFVSRQIKSKEGYLEYEWKDPIESKEGYLEYEWKNPGATKRLPKALYMVYFKPWDWIISASSYRNEFYKLINVEDFQKSVLSLKFRETGYSYVIDSTGKAVIHPKLQGVNILNEKELPHQFLKDMLERKKGKISYFWKNPDEPVARKKLVMFNYIPEYKWIVASSCYFDEIYSPLKTVRNFIIGISFSFLILMLFITFKISSSITNPLHEMMARFEVASFGNFSMRMKSESNDEVGQLAVYFNRFMNELENYNRRLQAQIQERVDAQEAQRESQERYFLLMESAPDPIVTYDINGNAVYVNPAFTKVFGWTSKECITHKMDHFVPKENWSETKAGLKILLSGKAVNNIETQRFSKNGDIVYVSISGAPTRDRNGEISGTIIVLRDITKSKQLEKQLMKVGDKERQEIGQNLHDDLCPHLIGIAGLVTVLKDDLDAANRNSLILADKIVHLIDDAIGKTRILARGLCPVHFVSHGLSAALEELIQYFEYIREVKFDIQVDDSIEFHDNTVATHLYYIAREAVYNAVKHSGADKIKLFMLKENKFVHLCIQDNGKGMDTKMKTRGIGLQIMAYRAKIIDSRFEINTDKQGSSIDVYLDNPFKIAAGESVI